MKTFVDLFCGIGGFHLALAERGLRCVWACDSDVAAQDTYEMHFGLRPKGDINSVAPESIPPHDVLCAGFPCQPFSLAGKRRGQADERGGFLPKITDIICVHRPRVVLLENVVGILSADGGAIPEMIESWAGAAGYRYSMCKLRASDFGVPQVRRRVFFVLLREDSGLPPFVAPEAPQGEIVTIGDILERDSDGWPLPYPDLQIDTHMVKWREADERVKARTPHSDPRRPQRAGYFGDLVAKSGRPSQRRRIYEVEYASPTLNTKDAVYIAARSRDTLRCAEWLKGRIGERFYLEDGASPALCADGGSIVGNGRAGVAMRDRSGMIVRRTSPVESRLIMGFPANHHNAHARAERRGIGNAVVPAKVGAIFDAICGGAGA